MLLRNRLPRNRGPHEGVFAGHLIANPNRWTDAGATLWTLENAAQHLRDAGVVRRFESFYGAVQLTIDILPLQRLEDGLAIRIFFRRSS